jgi:cytochrome P450
MRKGVPIFRKSISYDAAAFATETRSIVNVQDPAEHTRMRRAVARAFTDKALRVHEPLVNEVVNLCIDQLALREGQTLELQHWFTLISFDVITDLAMGESFGSVLKGERHPWPKFFQGAMRMMNLGVPLQRFPTMKKIALAFPPPMMRKLIQDLKIFEDFTRAQIKKSVPFQVHPGIK